MTLRLADTQAAAVLVDREPQRIRDWSRRGLITRRGTDPRGRALYDLNEVLATDEALRERRAS